MCSPSHRKNPPRPRLSDEDYRLLRECCAREGIRPGQFLSEAIATRVLGARKPTARLREISEDREFRRRACLVLSDLQLRTVEVTDQIRSEPGADVPDGDGTSQVQLLEEILLLHQRLLSLLVDSKSKGEQ